MSQIYNLSFHLKKQQKIKKQNKPKISGKKEIIKIIVKISEIQTTKTIKKINETNRCIFGKINKITNF